MYADGNQIFHATLVNLFSCTDGRWFIEARRYVISPRDRDTRIGDAEWQAVVRPGMRLDMDVVVFVAASREIHACPVCLAINAWSDHDQQLWYLS